MFYVGIDIGSYLCRLVIMKRVKNSLIPILSKTAVANFGVVKRGGSLSKNSIARFESIITDFKKQIEYYLGSNEYKMRSVATAAFRFAENAAEIVDYIEKKLGIKIEIISSKEEIYLAATGCSAYIDKSAVIIDVGSGSIEIAFVEKGKKIKVLDYISLTLGLMNNQVSEEQKITVLKKIAAFAERNPVDKVLCSKCSVLSIVYNHISANAKILEISQIKQTQAELEQLSDMELIRIRYIGRQKIRLIRYGLPWLTQILLQLGCKSLKLCEISLKDGIVMDLANDKS